MTPGELAAHADALEGQPPEVVLRWAADRFPGRVTFATGFGMEGCVLVDVIARHRIAVDVFTLDTGLLFPETRALWRTLEQRYGVTIRAVVPEQSVLEQGRVHGEALWQREPDRCCELRKVIPLRRALAGFDAWVSAIRREQTPDRAAARAVEHDAKFGLVKVNPLLAWTERDVRAYLERHDVPSNPMHAAGYPSIGCMPCTTPVRPGEDPRAGRWRGREKTECGLHALPSGPRAAQGRGFIVWFTGMSGAGKSTLAQALHERLAPHRAVEVLDGDEVRAYLSRGLGFSREDRDTNVRRIGYVARLLARHGVAVITAAISPYAATRDEVRQLAARDGVPFVEVFAHAELDALAARDVKGLYKKALAGEIAHFTGVSDPYEAPASPDVVVRSDREPVDASLGRILAALQDRGLVSPRTS